MEKWEYTTTKLKTKGFAGGKFEKNDFDVELNKFGEEGWELVSCFTTQEAYG